MAKRISYNNSFGEWECDRYIKDDCLCKACVVFYKWAAGDKPYERFYYLKKWRTMCSKIEGDIPFPSLSKKENRIVQSTEPFDHDCWSLHLQPIGSIIANWKQYGLTAMTQYFHTWAFWQVTGGRIRSDKNQRTWVLWNHKKKPITENNIATVVNDKKVRNMWIKVHDGKPHDLNIDVVKQITEATQDLAQEYLRLASNKISQKSRDSAQRWNTKWKNCNEMPTVKSYKSDIKKDFDHNRYKWHMAPQKLGGNMGYGSEPPPIKVSIPPIQIMLQAYHYWLNSEGSSIKRYKQPAVKTEGAIDKFLKT